MGLEDSTNEAPKARSVRGNTEGEQGRRDAEGEQGRGSMPLGVRSTERRALLLCLPRTDSPRHQLPVPHSGAGTAALVRLLQRIKDPL